MNIVWLYIPHIPPCHVEWQVLTQKVFEGETGLCYGSLLKSKDWPIGIIQYSRSHVRTLRFDQTSLNNHTSSNSQPHIWATHVQIKLDQATLPELLAHMSFQLGNKLLYIILPKHKIRYTSKLLNQVRINCALHHLHIPCFLSRWEWIIYSVSSTCFSMRVNNPWKMVSTLYLKHKSDAN
jgi:hypothetical protein